MLSSNAAGIAANEQRRELQKAKAVVRTK